MKKIFKIEVDCANCAAKVEKAISKLDGVKECNINFMTQKMLFEADDDKFDDILKLALKTGKKVEPDFEIIK
jgi:copper chaperone CopZ